MLIHFELIFEIFYEVRVWVSSGPSTIYERNYSFLVESSWHLVENLLAIDVWIYFWTLSYIGLYIYPYARTTLF